MPTTYTTTVTNTAATAATSTNISTTSTFTITTTTATPGAVVTIITVTNVNHTFLDLLLLCQMQTFVYIRAPSIFAHLHIFHIRDITYTQCYTIYTAYLQICCESRFIDPEMRVCQFVCLCFPANCLQESLAPDPDLCLVFL